MRAEADTGVSLPVASLVPAMSWIGGGDKLFHVCDVHAFLDESGCHTQVAVQDLADAWPAILISSVGVLFNERMKDIRPTTLNGLDVTEEGVTLAL